MFVDEKKFKKNIKKSKTSNKISKNENEKKIQIKNVIFSIVDLQVSTKAPLECMCRPCSGVEETSIVPQEIAGYTDEGPLNNHFRKAQLQ